MRDRKLLTIDEQETIAKAKAEQRRSIDQG